MPKKTGARNIRVNHAERWIYIQGAITATTAVNFEKQLGKLAKKNSAPVAVFLKSCGGDVFACLKIHQIIVDAVGAQVPVHTVGLTIVRSGAFFILQAGARRFATKKTRFMFHRAIRNYSDSTMNSTALAEELRQLAVVDAAQLLIYIKRGHPSSVIEKLFSRDAEIDTSRARKLNLIDAVVARSSFSKMRASLTS